MLELKPSVEPAEDAPDVESAMRSIEQPTDGYRLKMKAHDRNQVEIKLFAPLQSADEGLESTTLDIRVTVPRSLGSVNSSALIGMVNILDRVGFEQEISLEDIISSLNLWRVNVRRLLRGITNVQAPVTDNEKTCLAEFERHTRILGCLLKSSIRDHAQRLQDVNADTRLYACFSELITALSGLVDDVHRLCSGDGVALQVVKILEEYVLMTTERACSELAHRFPVGTECHNLAIDCAVEASQRLGATEGSSESWRDIRSEAYSTRYDELKYYFISSLYLKHKQQARSYMFHDIIGMVAAGTAMVVWVLIMWASELEIGRYNSTVFVVFVLGYILKDRIKEWGKRYFIPLLKQPDKTAKLFPLHETSTKRAAFGVIREWYKTRDSLYNSLAPPTIVGAPPSLNNNQPETVLHFRREVTLGKEADLHAVYLDLGDLCHLTHVQVIRLDLSPFRMAMKAPKGVIKLVDPGTRHAISLDCLHEYRFTLSASVSRQPKATCCGVKRKFKAKPVSEKETEVRIDATGIKGVRTVSS